MTALYLMSSLLAGLGFYLATAHQQFMPGIRAQARLLRTGAWLCTLLALFGAIRLLGVWAGVFAALTAVMLVAVLLPYLDAGLQGLRRKRHVG
jgi:hypothetical protein